jgi:hypothetical protein
VSVDQKLAMIAEQVIGARYQYESLRDTRDELVRAELRKGSGVRAISRTARMTPAAVMRIKRAMESEL